MAASTNQSRFPQNKLLERLQQQGEVLQKASFELQGSKQLNDQDIEEQNQGTGFFCTTTLALTAYHVLFPTGKPVDGETHFNVKYKDKNITLEVVENWSSCTAEADIAVLRLVYNPGNLKIEPVKVCYLPVELLLRMRITYLSSRPVVACGYPLNDASQEPRYFSGTVNSMIPLTGGVGDKVRMCIHLDVPGAPLVPLQGLSGGAISDLESGCVIAVATTYRAIASEVYCSEIGELLRRLTEEYRAGLVKDADLRPLHVEGWSWRVFRWLTRISQAGADKSITLRIFFSWVGLLIALFVGAFPNSLLFAGRVPVSSVQCTVLRVDDFVVDGKEVGPLSVYPVPANRSSSTNLLIRAKIVAEPVGCLTDPKIRRIRWKVNDGVRDWFLNNLNDYEQIDYPPPSGGGVETFSVSVEDPSTRLGANAYLFVKSDGSKTISGGSQ